jgi:hypothetical protein
MRTGELKEVVEVGEVMETVPAEANAAETSANTKSDGANLRTGEEKRDIRSPKSGDSGSYSLVGPALPRYTQTREASTHPLSDELPR